MPASHMKSIGKSSIRGRMQFMLTAFVADLMIIRSLALFIGNTPSMLAHTGLKHSWFGKVTVLPGPAVVM